MAREVVNSGPYGLELMDKMVRDLLRSRGLWREECGGGEVVEREDVGGHHG